MPSIQKQLDLMIMQAIVRNMYDRHVGRTMDALVNVMTVSVCEAEKAGNATIRQEAVDYLLRVAADLDKRLIR
jgi:hypothetical protein